MATSVSTLPNLVMYPREELLHLGFAGEVGFECKGFREFLLEAADFPQLRAVVSHNARALLPKFPGYRGTNAA